MNPRMESQTIDTEEIAARPTTVRWSAIFAGWLIAFSTAVLFYLLGSAIGISTVNATESVNKGIAISSVVWVFLSYTVSLFFGGMAASWFTEAADRASGALHGVLVWGLSGLLTAAFGLSGLMYGTAAAGKALGTLGSGIAATAAPAAGVAAANADKLQGIQNQPQFLAFQSQLKDAISKSAASNTGTNAGEIRSAIDQIKPEVLGQAANEIIQGNPENAKNVLAVNTNLERNDIDAIISGVEQKAAEAREQLQATAKQAANAATAAFWALFFSSVIALLTAAWGGMLGARYAVYRRVRTIKKWHQAA
jgi:hypothetical protein